MNIFNDEAKAKELQDLRKKKFSEIEDILRSFEFDVQTMLSSFVASICDVDEVEMLSPTNKLYVAQSRWLFWYAYRNIGFETYERISDRTMLGGSRFTKDAIRKGCEKMSSLIDTNKMWRGRWAVIRRMTAILKDPHDYYCGDFANPLPEKYKLTLSVPKEIKDRVQIEVK